MRTSFLIPLVLAIGLSGCYYDDDDDGVYQNDFPSGSCDANPVLSTIDTDAALEVDVGTGVGLFVEYEAGGRWFLYTTCDSDVSGFDCGFNVLVSPTGGSPILALYPADMERADDSLTLYGEDTAEFIAVTDFDTDGFVLDTDPGVALNIDVLLDGACASEFAFWIGDGATHSGAPTNPFELEPSAP